MDSTPRTAGTFTALEQVILTLAVQDWAGTYHSTIGDPVRYVVEGHLAALVEAHGTVAVWDAVAETVKANPEVLDLPVQGRGGREARQAARAARAADLVAQANQAFRAGDHQRALELIDQAELTEPTHVPARGVTFARVREAIAAAAAA